MSVPALEMNVLRPLISQPPSRRTARVRMPRASEPASGSVKPNAPSARPSASGRSQRSRCASVPKRYSGNEPMVTCACHAAATDWSARPICSIAATKPTVDMPMPPHCSGISMPSRPSAPISRSRSVGQRASSHASGARAAISFCANSRHRPTRSRSGSVSEKSTGRSYWTDRYNACYSWCRDRLRRDRLLPRQRARRRPVPVLRLAARAVPGAARAPPRRDDGDRVRGSDRGLQRHRRRSRRATRRPGRFPGFPVAARGRRRQRADRSSTATSCR